MVLIVAPVLKAHSSAQEERWPRQWHLWPCNATTEEMEQDREACPCCGHLTLRERGGFEICPVCFWEDDGQDDVDAHGDRGGPNRGTLWQARASYLRCGACEEVARDQVRRPNDDEPQVRSWSLLDDIAIELIPCTDVSPWNLLHDAAIVALRRTKGARGRSGDRVTIRIDIPYLRTRFEEKGEAFVVELVDCTELAYAPYEGEPPASIEAIADEEPEILSAEVEDDCVVVSGTAGVLRLRYEGLALRFDSGAPLALAALDACARDYWDAWERGGTED